jgi:tetratricopeptide (TPR) repeat protein
VGRIVLLVAVVALASGCSTMRDLKHRAQESTRGWISKSYEDPQAEAKVADAERVFHQNEYEASRKAFREVADNTLNPVMLAEKARFMEAECYRFEKKYPDAVDTYHKMLMEYPSGAYRERACTEMFKIADYWLDDTRDEIQARDDGENGTVYRMKKLLNYDRTKPSLDREGRALQTLDHVHLNDITGPNADKALFWCGFVNFYRGNYVEADHYFSTLVEFHKESPLRPKATELAIISKNNATGGAEYDGQKAAEALQLVHHAEGAMPEFNTDERKDFLSRQKLAIRMQQAEKDFKMAEYYEQTKHPGSAYYSYEIVRRRYPGSKYAEIATERMAVLKDKAELDGSKPKRIGPVTMVRESVDRMLGRATPEKLKAAVRTQPLSILNDGDKMNPGPSASGALPPDNFQTNR